MKKNVLQYFSSAMLAVTLLACGPQSKQEDSKAIAEEQNEEKFEDANLEKDTEFAVTAADGGMLEVQLGKLAQTNASSAQVKKFAQMMVEDHSKANDELKALAQQKGITLPTALSEDHQKKYNDIAEKTGEAFDKEYMDFMVKDHKEDINAFQNEAENGNDQELKTWAAGKVPTLQHHLEMAQAAQDIVNNNNK